MRRSLCSQSIRFPPQRGDFPILAQRAQYRFISHQRERTGKTTLVGISSSPLNAQEGSELRDRVHRVNYTWAQKSFLGLILRQEVMKSALT